MKRGFTLIELLIVIAILAVLSSIVLSSLRTAREKAYEARGRKELLTLYTALQEYITDHQNQVPADVSRGLPPGLEAYLPAGHWPDAPWPGSVYDWDVWDDPLAGPQIQQISIRFCPVGGPLSACRFPEEDWAQNFGVNSAMYYCIQGACRSHINESYAYPGYCVNC